MYEQTHTTTPGRDGGTFHQWEIRGDRGSVSLTLLSSTDKSLISLAEVAPAVAAKVAVGQAGTWVFDVIQTHRVTGNPTWGCHQHEGCDMDAIATSVADPIWQRLRAGGITDGSVFAELQPLFAVAFGQVTA